MTHCSLFLAPISSSSSVCACMEDEVKERGEKPSNPFLISFYFWKLAFVELPGAAPVSPTAARALFIGRGLKSNWPYSCTARPLLVLMLHNTRRCSGWGMQVIQWRGRHQEKSTKGVWIWSTGGWILQVLLWTSLLFKKMSLPGGRHSGTVQRF